MDPVGELGAGTKQLVTVLGQELEVGKRLDSPWGRERLAPGHDAGDRNRVDRI